MRVPFRVGFGFCKTMKPTILGGEPFVYWLSRTSRLQRAPVEPETNAGRACPALVAPHTRAGRRICRRRGAPPTLSLDSAGCRSFVGPCRGNPSFSWRSLVGFSVLNCRLGFTPTGEDRNSMPTAAFLNSFFDWGGLGCTTDLHTKCNTTRHFAQFWPEPSNCSYRSAALPQDTTACDRAQT